MDLPRNKLTAVPHKVDGEKSTVNDAFTAALTPLEDLGLRKRDIPEMLQALTDNPYAMPEKFKCDTVKTEMAKLDLLLGPDVDTPKVALSANEQYAETGSELMHDAVVGLVKSQTSIIPMRSIVRRLTGAESHEKAVAKAAEAGKLRRAYLRGLADARFGSKCRIRDAVIVVNADQAVPKADPNAGLEVAKK